MNTSELKVSLPIGLSEDDARLFLAVKLYEVGKVSIGQAAKLANFSKRSFIEILGRDHIPIFAYDPGELHQEIDL